MLMIAVIIFCALVAIINNGIVKLCISIVAGLLMLLSGFYFAEYLDDRDEKHGKT